MKSGTLISVIALISVASISLADNTITVEDIYGTWVNQDYKFGFAEDVIIINPDHTIVGYQYKTDVEPAYICQFPIAESWYDNEGNLWI